MDQPTPARAYSLLTGAFLCLFGLASLLVAGDFRIGDDVAEGRGDLIGLDVNGWTAAFVLGVGAAGLIAARAGAGTAFAFVGGAGLAAAGVLARRAGDDGVRFDRFAVDDGTGLVLFVLGVLGLVAGLATLRGR